MILSGCMTSTMDSLHPPLSMCFFSPSDNDLHRKDLSVFGVHTFPEKLQHTKKNRQTTWNKNNVVKYKMKVPIPPMSGIFAYTFIVKTNLMWVNTPYMDPMGLWVPMLLTFRF